MRVINRVWKQLQKGWVNLTRVLCSATAEGVEFPDVVTGLGVGCHLDTTEDWSGDGGDDKDKDKEPHHDGWLVGPGDDPVGGGQSQS